MNELQWLFDLIRSMGVAGGPVFFVLWYLANSERQAAQKEHRALLVQVLTTTAQVTNSVLEVTKAVAAVGDAARNTNGSLAQLTQLIISGLIKQRGN